MPNYEGRLELTWTNKSLRLLAHEDGSYQWVSPSDYRGAEVHLLHDAGAGGELHGARAVGCGGARSGQSALFGGRDRRCLPSKFGGDHQQPDSRSALKDAIVADQGDLVVRCRGGNPQIVRVDFLGESVSLPETPQTKIGACPRELIVAGRNHRAGDPLLELLESRLAPVSFARPQSTTP
ncbi:MAG: hypothetical protein M3Z66_13310 [Chloroflexota bacterium]|nr:hypothetical protein [Chloroflexota bacterium]